MARAEGKYKRLSQVIIIFVAFIVVILLNADTVMWINTLRGDPTLRAAAASALEKYAGEQGNTTLDEATSMYEALLKLEGRGSKFPVGWTTKEDRNCADQQSLPWKPCTDVGKGAFNVPPEWFGTKLVGLILTVVLISLGSPFWFDVLNKLVNLRMTGRPIPADEGESKPASHSQQARGSAAPGST